MSVSDPQAAAKRILDRDAIGWGEVRLVARAYQEAIEALGLAELALHEAEDTTDFWPVHALVRSTRKKIAPVLAATPTPTKENDEKGTA